MIAKFCDYGSLRSIVHASPSFHSVYLSAREELLALVTIRQLTDRGFNFFGKYNIMEVGGAKESSGEAAATLYRQCQRHVSTNHKHIIRLDVRSCIVLLGVKYAIGWRLKPVEGRQEAKLKRQKLSGQMIQLQDSLHYEITLLSPWEPGWLGIYSDRVFSKIMTKHYKALFRDRNEALKSDRHQASGGSI